MEILSKGKFNYNFFIFTIIILVFLVFTINIVNSKESTKTTPTQKLGTRERYEVICWGTRAGMTLYAYSVALSDIASKYSDWLKITVIEGSPTAHAWVSLDNPDRRKHTIAAQDWRRRWSYMKGLFGADKIKYDWSKVHLLTMINFLVDGLVTLDSKIKTFKDIKGKRVSYGELPKSDFEYQFSKLLEFEGMTLKDLASFEYMALPAAAKALADGRLDVCIVGYSLTSINPIKFDASPFAVELATTKDLHFIDMNPEAVRYVSTLMPAFPVWVPAGVLRGQKKEHIGIGKYLSFICDRDLPDEVVTEIARLVYEHADMFGKYVPVGRIMSKDTMCAMNATQDEFHPAMWKFIQKHGIRTNHILEGIPGGDTILRVKK